MPSGSVLSRKWVCRGAVEASTSASVMNCGPRAEPPMPMMRRWVNGLPFCAVMVPLWIWLAKFLQFWMSAVMELVISWVGARVGLRSQ